MYIWALQLFESQSLTISLTQTEERDYLASLEVT